ncbi:hypothetical protein GH714_003791 [Hevea brasiliensis]|uniref:Uncharacterized protein n=1 Tax=Hevea brasiliensis TaxID=3981 RepID=A0A6A6M757_HEVBR|nr:hypothetical protein GH714_003791 [Hevea brasiliensis]
MAAFLSGSFYALITDKKSKGTGLPDKMFWFVIPVLFLHCFMAMAVTNLSTDESALLALKAHITVDPHNVTTYNWSSTSSVCNWVGISCGARHRRVTALNLTNMGLQGIIPLHLGNLSFLGYLTASGNKFQGRLPEELSRLRRLKVINFNENNLGGDLPSWFANLTSLQTLNLANNTFVGTIPVEIGNLTRLRILNLQQNQLSGTIPRRLCNIKGIIPVQIGNLSTMVQMELSLNELIGSIPSTLGGLKQLQDIGNLKVLVYMDLSRNQISGAIPSSIGGLKDLQYLSLAENSFQGSIPVSFGAWRDEHYAVGETFMPDAITEVVDSNLLRVERPSIAETDSVMSTLKLALHCCADLPEDRLHMKDVLSSLEKIRTQYLKDLRDKKF